MGLDALINIVLHVNTVYCRCQFIIKFDVGQSSYTTLARYVEI